MRVSRWAPLALGGVVWVSACAASRPATARPDPMRLDRVVLYQNGIGHFERSGHLEGNHLRLSLRPHEVDDVIKTLTVIDRAGQAQTVAAVLPTPAQSTGERVVIDIVLSKPGRDLEVAYAVPTASWKATYRVALPDKPGGQALLQAWAMVDNVSEEAWRGVKLTLATGAPLSFATDLRTPHFVPRPDATGTLVQPGALAPVLAERGKPGDRDADGIADASDVCPDQEDRDGFQDDDGCPDLDNDNDRVLDADDRCPNEPEIYNGLEDEDGCPDRGRVLISESRLMILDKVYFGVGVVEPPPAAYPIIDAVAATLKGNPQIRSLSIAGHAASDERDAWAVSARRATAIRRILQEKGVTQQLEVVPFGDTQPIAREAEKNRRVEFDITGRDDDASETVNGTSDGGGRAVSPRRGIGAEALARSVAARGSTREVAGATRYELAERVSVPRGASTLVSVLSKRTAGEDVFLFRPDPGAPGSDLHPLRAARIVLPREVGLEPGPVAVFSQGTFAGEGLLERTSGGETAYIPYAVDGGTVVRVEVTGDERPQRLIAVARGVATVENATIRRTTYTIEPGAQAAGRIFLRHEPAAGFTMGELPPGSERGERALLVPVPLVGGRVSKLVIEERQPVERRIAILDREGASLALYIDGANLPPTVLAQVRVIAEARAELGKVEGEIEAVRDGLADASERGSDLERSLATVAKLPGPDAAALKKRLIASIAAQTTHADELARRLVTANARQLEARARVQTAIEGLSLELASQ